ncbi:MAG: hypothetical protein AAF641_01220 [Pseudomonadota bacterium]
MGGRAAICVLAALLSCSNGSIAAADDTGGREAFFTSEPYIVGNDHGGSVQQRLKDVAALRASGRSVEIRGLVCHSSCTMLLGLEQVCVQPHTRFGFHGPSRNGAPLKMTEFEAVSQIIAAQYPPVLRQWYLDVARHSLDRLHVLSGAELIARGVARDCDPVETASTAIKRHNDGG